MSILTIGHRGAKGHYPENTLLSFGKALSLGAHAIELDVHLSSDGEIMVIHDETVNRVTNGTGRVNDTSRVELRKLNIHDTEKIPLLHEVFDAFPNLLINIELKVKEAAAPVVGLIEKYVLEKDYNYSQFLISSFDWTALQHVRERQTKIPIGVLTETDLDLAIHFAKFLNAETIHPHYHLLTKDNTRTMQAAGLRVYAWTVNEPEDILLLKSFNIDGIITDFPERI